MQYEYLTQDLGGITEGEVYFWAEKKRDENLLHRSVGHDRRFGFCPKCDNCLCTEWGRTKQFRCMCSQGRRMVSPHHIRFMNSRDKERHA